MSYNTTILSYNKNEEIEELDPASSPSISSRESNDKNQIIYNSFYIPTRITLNEYSISSNNLFHSNTNINIFKSYSASPLLFNTNTKNTNNYTNNINNTNTNRYNTAKQSIKTKKIFDKKKLDDKININNKININDTNNKMNHSTKLRNPILKKKPRKKKLMDSYNSYRNIYENKKLINKIKKMKTVSVRKKEEVKDLKKGKEKEKEISNGNITLKNENLENRIEIDKANKKINIYIKNNIYNYNLIHEINSNNKQSNIMDSQSSITKTDIKIPSQEYFNKNNGKNNNNITKKSNNKKPSIKIAPMDYINNNNNSSNKKNLFLKENNNDKNNILKNNKFQFDFPFFYKL